MKYLIIVSILFSSCALRKQADTTIHVALTKYIYQKDTVIIHDTLYIQDTGFTIQVNVKPNQDKCEPKVIQYSKHIIDTFYIPIEMSPSKMIIKTKITTTKHKDYWWLYPLLLWSLFTTILVFGTYVHLPNKQIN